jgi:membrane associated rhomboid family serine protease
MSGGVAGSPQPEQPDQPDRSGPFGPQGFGVNAGPRCYRHADRETHIHCQRCGRPICPDCMRQAAVGFHCPECVAQGRASTPRPRTVYGGRVTGRANAVTLALIGLNVLMFLALQVSNTLAVQTVLVGGAVAQGEAYRLLTSMFVHLQFMQLLFNMFALWIFGPVLEGALGRLRFLALYLLSGLTGAVAVYWLADPNIPTVGASGAVFGLLGAALVVSVRRGYDVTWLLGLLGINLVFTFLVPNISWQGHLGGLVGGLVVGAAIAWAPRRHRTVLQAAAFVLVFALCVLLIVLRTSQLVAV